MAEDVFLLGNGAGFAVDRPDAGAPVVDALIRDGRPAAMFYEMLAERTLALALVEMRGDPEKGYAAYMVEMVAPVLRKCVEAGIPLIGNFGSANPHGAARRLIRLAREQGLKGLRVAVIEGDDLRDRIRTIQTSRWEAEEPIDLDSHDLISANAYLGGKPVADALAMKPHVVVTGRVTDSALAVGPLMHHFGWDEMDWDKMAAAVTVGHLLECGSQVTGGYFADPGYKDVPGLADVGFPIAEVESCGAFTVTKPEGTGGLVSPRTVKEQLLYEIHDPGAYLTPDVTLDMNAIGVAATGPDRVRISGARGKPRPETLKVTVSVDGGWLGEGEISYAGPNALARAKLAGRIARERIGRVAPGCPVRTDIIGLVSVLDDDGGTIGARADGGEHPDLRLRVAVKGPDQEAIARAAREIEMLYCAGPAGGGGVRRRETWRVRTGSLLVPREYVEPKISLIEDRDV